MRDNDTSRDPWEELEDRFFVAGQMDAQGTAAEKWKIGSGGPVLALSKRMLGEARALVAKLKAELEARERIIEVYEGQLAKQEQSRLCPKHMHIWVSTCPDCNRIREPIQP